MPGAGGRAGGRAAAARSRRPGQGAEPAGARQYPNNAQTNAAANPAAQVAPAAAASHVIQHIVVRGHPARRAGTVLTYVGLREGDNFTPADADTALKALFATGLFADVKTNFDGHER